MQKGAEAAAAVPQLVDASDPLQSSVKKATRKHLTR